MKRLLAVIILTLSIHSLIAQEISEKDKKDISKRLDEYTQLTNKGNWKALVEHIYPGLFTVVPKESMIGVFSSFSSMGIKMSMDEMNVKSYEMLGKMNGETFVAIPYTTQVYMTFSGDATSSMEMVKEQMILQFGVENVTIDEDENRLSFAPDKTMLAVYIEKEKDWYFIEYEANKQEIFNQIVPEEIVEKLKAL
ncbi:MAG: hypothetical protein NXI20_08525 [bacterium]|nr:hypothetical protein [bacterium]